MRKLLSLAPEMQAALKRIGDVVAEREALDPVSCSYVCHRCSDTGFKVTTKPSGSFGEACEWCLSGQEVLRMQRAWREKQNKFKQARLQIRKGNRVLMTEEPLGEDEIGDPMPW